MRVPDREARARRAVFEWLDYKLGSGRPELTRDELDSFVFESEPLKLLDRGRGIRNPAWFTATLSVMTTPKGPYDDEIVEGGMVRYNYQGDRDNGDNVKLRRAAELGAPIVYFRKIRDAAFVAHYPVFVTDLPGERAVLFSIDEEFQLFGDPLAMSPAQRRYTETQVLKRLHQPIFRAQVLHAYGTRCAVCHLGHPDLLDAAHIIPDSDERGVPEVPNGLSLCKIHHAAYDKAFIGISPDYEVHVRDELLAEIDGPMLRHGIQAMHGRRIAVPRSRAERPKAEYLEARFDLFMSSN